MSILKKINGASKKHNRRVHFLEDQVMSDDDAEEFKIPPLQPLPVVLSCLPWSSAKRTRIDNWLMTEELTLTLQQLSLKHPSSETCRIFYTTKTHLH